MASNVGVRIDILGATFPSTSSGDIMSSNGRSERCHWLEEIFPKNSAFAPGSAMYAAAPSSCNVRASAT